MITWIKYGFYPSVYMCCNLRERKIESSKYSLINNYNSKEAITYKIYLMLKKI